MSYSMNCKETRFFFYFITFSSALRGSEKCSSEHFSMQYLLKCATRIDAIEDWTYHYISIP